MSRVTQRCMRSSAPGPEHFVLAERRQVHDYGARSRHAQYSSIDPMSGKILREPVAVVLDEIPGMGGKAIVESGVLRHLEIGIGGHSEPHGWFEVLVSVIHPYLDVGRIPPVLQESMSQGQAVEKQTRSVRARMSTKSPGRDQGSSIPMALAVVEHGVEEEIDGGPSAARGVCRTARLRYIDVVRAVSHAPGIPCPRSIARCRQGRTSRGVRTCPGTSSSSGS